MGRPMAANLVGAGWPLTVYNRSAPSRDALVARGAQVADCPADLFAASDCIFLMLANDQAVDAVLGRGEADFESRVAGKIIVNLGTHAPAWSLELQYDIGIAGGRFVEAPVSGSRGPAEAGSLVAMLAGEEEAVRAVRPLMEPMCRQVVETGPVPSALRCKLAVNLYLIATVAALAEAAKLAQLQGVDPDAFAEVIGAGPLGSDVARAKLAKMIDGDFSPQAAIHDVCKNAELVEAAAVSAALHPVVFRGAKQLFDAVLASGGGAHDMAAVITAWDFGTSLMTEFPGSRP